MEPEVNEKRYPIETVSVIKSAVTPILPIVVMSLVMALGIFLDAHSFEVTLYFVLAVLFLPFNIIYFFVWRNSFTYALNEQFMTLGQGILSRQQRNIPYGVLQNILIKQDLMDRLLGLGTLVVENAAQNGAAPDSAVTIFGMRVQPNGKEVEVAGFSGNRVMIPGLKLENAQTFRDAILKKMKEHPLHDNESGL